jgi:hypothetical protein
MYYNCLTQTAAGLSVYEYKQNNTIKKSIVYAVLS